MITRIIEVSLQQEWCCPCVCPDPTMKTILIGSFVLEIGSLFWESLKESAPMLWRRYVSGMVSKKIANQIEILRNIMYMSRDIMDVLKMATFCSRMGKFYCPANVMTTYLRVWFQRRSLANKILRNRQSRWKDDPKHGLYTRHVTWYNGCSHNGYILRSDHRGVVSEKIAKQI